MDKFEQSLAEIQAIIAANDCLEKQLDKYEKSILGYYQKIKQYKDSIEKLKRRSFHYEHLFLFLENFEKEKVSIVETS